MRALVYRGIIHGVHTQILESLRYCKPYYLDFIKYLYVPKPYLWKL